MLPNLRLTIAAVFASILALCCGFAMFAAVRVSHAPLARASSAVPGLQLTAANGPRLPLNLAAAEPFDHRFAVEQQAKSDVRALAYAAPQPADTPVTQLAAPAADSAEQTASEPETATNQPVAAPAPSAVDEAAPAQAVETAAIPPAEATSPTESEAAPSPSRQAAPVAAGTAQEIKPEQEAASEPKPELTPGAKLQEAAAAPSVPPPPASAADIKCQAPNRRRSRIRAAGIRSRSPVCQATSQPRRPWRWRRPKNMPTKNRRRRPRGRAVTCAYPPSPTIRASDRRPLWRNRPEPGRGSRRPRPRTTGIPEAAAPMSPPRANRVMRG